MILANTVPKIQLSKHLLEPGPGTELAPVEVSAEKMWL